VLASFARRFFQADRQSSARAAARIPGRTTSIRIIPLSNNVDEEEGSFSFKKKEAAASAAGILKIKLRWPSTTSTDQPKPFRLT